MRPPPTSTSKNEKIVHDEYLKNSIKRWSETCRVLYVCCAIDISQNTEWTWKILALAGCFFSQDLPGRHTFPGSQRHFDDHVITPPLHSSIMRRCNPSNDTKCLKIKYVPQAYAQLYSTIAMACSSRMVLECSSCDQRDPSTEWINRRLLPDLFL